MLIGIGCTIAPTYAFVSPVALISSKVAPRRRIASSSPDTNAEPTDDESSGSPNASKVLAPLESLQTKVKATQQSFQSAADEGFGTRARNAANSCSVGDIIVPLCSNLAQRQILANRGIYAGVEYRVVELSTSIDDDEPTNKVDTVQGLSSPTQALALILPAYPLRDHLERSDWPVSVTLDEVPLWLSRSTYIAGNALGTAALSSFFLVVAAVISFYVRIVSIPSPSMLPSLSPGNVVLVTRSFPIGPFKPRVGDVVFFDAPTELESTVSSLKAKIGDGSEVASTKGKQFLKRVVATPGERVGVKRSEPYVEMVSSGDQDGTRYRFDIIGPYSKPELFEGKSWDRKPATLARDEWFVAGDNGFRSVDSRVWGPLKDKYIVGTAKLRLWPLKDFGPIPPGPIQEIVSQASER